MNEIDRGRRKWKGTVSLWRNVDKLRNRDRKRSRYIIFVSPHFLKGD